LKRLSLQPYHLFEYRGMSFAADTEKLTFIRLDPISRDLLGDLVAGASLGAAATRLEATHGAQAAEHAIAEYLTLRQNGYLKGPVLTYDARDYERLTARVLKMATGTIELYLAEACNMRCRYCYANTNDALGSGLMSWDVARAAVDLVFRRAVDVDIMQITFFGGEPLLNKPVMGQVIEYSQQLAKQHNKTMRYSLTTNATLLDDQVIDWIKRYNFGLMISADGPPAVHDDMRPMADGRGSFGIMSPKVKELMRRRRQVTARCTVSNRHLNLYEIVTFLEQFGFTRVGLSTCQGKSYHLGPFDVGPERKAEMETQLDLLMDRWIDQVKKGEPLCYDPYTSSIHSFHSKRTRAPMLHCGVCRGCTTVGVDGSLYPCHRYVGMKNYVIGTVWDGVDDTKHADYLRQYFKTKEKCESCWAINFCGGMCVWYVSHEDGTCRPPEGWRCDSVRRWIEKTAWIYERVREECPEFVGRIAKEYDEAALVAEGKPTETRTDNATSGHSNQSLDQTAT